MLDLHARRHATSRAAREAGIPIHVSTDGGAASRTAWWSTEMHELLACGFSNAEALDAGSWAARRRPSGMPGVGDADADLLVLAGDPRDDLGVLRIPIAIRAARAHHLRPVRHRVAIAVSIRVNRFWKTGSRAIAENDGLAWRCRGDERGGQRPFPTLRGG